MKKTAVIVICGLLTAFFSGCSREVPDPPRIRTDLTISIFQSLAREDYDSALIGVDKLSHLNDRDSFLPQMRSTIIANRAIRHAEKMLEQGKRKEAEKVISDAAAEYGNSAQLSAAKRKTAELAEMEMLLKIMEKPRSSDQLQESAERFLKLAGQNSCKGVFLSYPKQRLLDAEKLRRRERKITGYDLDCDLFELVRENAAGTIQAQLRLYSEQSSAKNVY